MMTFAVFGAGFLMRPIGAIVLGAYIDKVGRRKGLIVTLSIMAAGTFLIVLIPLTKASGFGRRCWCCAGACCKASRRARSWAACPFIWPRSPRQAVRLLHQLAVRQPAGGYHGGGSHGLRAQCGAGRKRHSRVGLAHSVPVRLPDRSLHLHPAPQAGRDAGIYRPPSPPGDARRV